MPHQSTVYLTLLIGMSLLAGLCLPLTGLSAAPQNQQRSRIKTFGESLKRDGSPEQSAGKKSDSPAAEARAGEEEVVRLKTTLVTADVLVLDPQGRGVKGLKQSDFIIKEDGQAQEVASLSLGDDAAIARSIVLIIDYSGSQLPFIETSVEAAKVLVDQLNPKDRMAIVTDDIALLVDFTSDKKLLKKSLDSLKKRVMSGKPGLSRQLSALLATLNELFDEEDLRPIIIFQTDGDELHRLGKDPNSRFPLPGNLTPQAKESLQKRLKLEMLTKPFTLEELMIKAEKSRATIYTVIPGHKLIGLSPEEQVNQMKREFVARFAIRHGSEPSSLPEASQLPAEVFVKQARNMLASQVAISSLAKLTGGWHSFLEEPSQAADIYARMLSDINLRYVLGYYPSNEGRDGKRRKLQIEVRNHPEYTVLSRKSYYAPDPEK
jgi:VWFA-related protein